MPMFKRMSMLVLAIVMAATMAKAKTSTRPIEDFLIAQGTMVNFVPPIPDYLGWVDADVVNFALVDYAGLAAAAIEAAHPGLSLNTTVTGSITEKVLEHGRLEVRIHLQTQNALAWGFEIAAIDETDPLPFLNTPLAFGYRAQDIIADPSLVEEAAWAHVSFKIEFVHNAVPGDPLPDLNQLIFNPTADQVVTLIDFQATADGPLRVAFGTPEGTPGRLEIEQECESAGEDNPCTFTKEMVDLLIE